MMFGFLIGEILYFQICNIRMLLKQSKRYFIAFTYFCPSISCPVIVLYILFFRQPFRKERHYCFLNPFDHSGQSLSQFLDAMMKGLFSPKVPIAESVQGSGEC